MDEKILKWLFDIKTAIDEIDGYFVNEKLDFFEYRNNQMRKRAVERNLEIIGEATNRIIKYDKRFLERIKDATAIVSLRNYVIHSYDSVSDETIWAVLSNHLPILKNDINNLLDSN